MISFSAKGDWSKTERYLKKLKKKDYYRVLHKYGSRGVTALANATPADTGATAEQWRYEVFLKGDDGSSSIVWFNDNNEGGANVAVLIQYGHGTRTGGYVRGRDYINPAMQPIFNQIAKDLWAEIKRL